MSTCPLGPCYGELPKISESMRRAEISYSKVRALTRVATVENVASS